MQLRVPGQEKKKIWREKDCQARKLKSEDAVDCKRWRKQIRDY